jgi:hypothetical protein
VVVQPAGYRDRDEPERVQKAGHSGSNIIPPCTASTSISRRICQIEFPDTTRWLRLTREARRTSLNLNSRLIDREVVRYGPPRRRDCLQFSRRAQK